MPPDFIEVYERALDVEFCAAMVALFEQSALTQPGKVGGGVYTELKDSRDLAVSALPEWADCTAVFNAALLGCLRAYVRKYPHLLLAPLMLETHDASGKAVRMDAPALLRLDDAELNQLLLRLLRPGSINVQRYRAGTGGYPYWHCELYPRDASAETLHRTLLWTAYLNDNFAEGETEFLYQSRKIVPKTGSILLAPTAFTHTHRGNTPRTSDKYIATSWVLFQRAENIFSG
jgi:hypothetical protein